MAVAGAPATTAARYAATAISPTASVMRKAISGVTGIGDGAVWIWTTAPPASAAISPNAAGPGSTPSTASSQNRPVTSSRRPATCPTTTTGAPSPATTVPIAATTTTAAPA